MESFQVSRASWGSNCICMQLKTFGLNERVTLGTNTAPDHRGRGLLNFTLHHQLRLRLGMRFSKLHQHISILWCFRMLFFCHDGFSSRANLVSPRERPLKYNLTLINVFTLVTVSLPLNQTSTYTITPISKYWISTISGAGRRRECLKMFPLLFSNSNKDL